jgi:hypothetical protein
MVPTVIDALLFGVIYLWLIVLSIFVVRKAKTGPPGFTGPMGVMGPPGPPGVCKCEGTLDAGKDAIYDRLRANELREEDSR